MNESWGYYTEWDKPDIKGQMFVWFCLWGTRVVNGTPLQYSCLKNPMDGGAGWAAVHEVAKSWTQLSDFTFTFHFHALEKEMAIHSSVLAWRIPGTGAWWAAVYGVTQSRTRLKWLSSSSSSWENRATVSCFSLPSREERPCEHMPRWLPSPSHEDSSH